MARLPAGRIPSLSLMLDMGLPSRHAPILRGAFCIFKMQFGSARGRALARILYGLCTEFAEKCRSNLISRCGICADLLGN